MLRTVSGNDTDRYVTSAPNAQNAIDIFRGEWASALPRDTGLVAGKSALFEDERVSWALSELGGVQGARVLELGPLEGGHTYMLQGAGAKEIVAVEANTRAYLKCLVVKELLGLDRARFLCGDFVAFLREDTTKFDACVASGVLYHMTKPAELLALLCRAADRVFLWTHYYDRELLAERPSHLARFTRSLSDEHEGFRHTLHRQEYRAAPFVAGFCGGSAPFSHWMTREDILAGLRHFGMTDIRVGCEAPRGQNGPSFAVVAQRP